ncbi:MAG: lactate dehydrogenase [Bacillota bacterium]|nr:lactate dehydrogenase [Bacillota bacterium]
MKYSAWHGFCLCGQERQFPPEARPVDVPFSPLVFLVTRDPRTARGWFTISHPAELYEPEGLAALTPCDGEIPRDFPRELVGLVEAHGACVLNTAFARAFPWLLHQKTVRREGFKITLVGLGDVGGTVLTGLKLLGRELREIAIFDPNAALCARYEMELNQILPETAGGTTPRVTICPEADLFHCDLLAFTASRGVPGLDSGVQDVRMAQFEANRAMIAPYARRAREEGFLGVFCQISDPVDNLAREVFLQSNQTQTGDYDFAGLLPEQVQGFGLGVMAARAAYYAEKEGVDFSQGGAYGPHGQGLVIANHKGNGYDEALSQRLTRLTREANLRVRDLGFKPYIAPGLSSAAVSLLQLLRGEEHYGAVPLGGVYFGCRSRYTPQGLAIQREPINQGLMARLAQTHRALWEFDTP